MYATVDNVKDRMRFVVEGIYGDDAGIIDDDLVTDDLTAASATIDGAAAARYQIPVTDNAALSLLRSWCLALVAELAYQRTASDELPKKVKDNADNVRASLKRLAIGEFRLPGVQPETTTGSGSVAVVSIADPVFTRDKMTGF